MTHVEIWCGVPAMAWTDTAAGRRYDFEEIGERRFFVDLIEPEGRAGMWEGTSYEAAILEAYELAAAWDDVIEVVDHVGGGEMP